MSSTKRGGKKTAPGRQKKKVEGEAKHPEISHAEDAGDFAMPRTQLIVPENQLKLTKAQLDEEVTRVLTSDDPNQARNLVAYHFKDREFKDVAAAASNSAVFHFQLDGAAMHHESEEAVAQVEYERELEKLAIEKRKQLLEEAKQNGESDANDVDDGGGKNQFNYSERAAQTYNSSMKTRSVTTVPPQTHTFGFSATQWDIYDTYVAEFERLKHQADIESGKLSSYSSLHSQKRDDNIIHSPAMARSVKVIERMVNQNAEDEIYNDFKYWEDLSDEWKQGQGTLLPLWRFADARTRKKQVTALAWNPVYSDLFAVGYGSYDFMKQGSGMIAVYSLKNTSHPEFAFSTDSGVMCLQFHPQHHALLAVGCYDGTVRVFDVRRKENKHIFISDIRSGKHTDPVWQVHWQDEDTASDLNFYSISSDGRVSNWVMSKNELKMEPIMTLKLVTSAKVDDAEEETSLTGLAGGCCFDFNKHSEHLFIVGTEEGRIHKCSKAYSGQYLETYEGQHMAVYSVKWNPFHPRVFLSCSADWTVKLWDHNLSTPIMTFDLGNAVGDVAWAPYSSTVFAAVTSDGKVHVYDLSVNKNEQICEQKVVKRAHLTHVVFNQQHPIILVGDDRGSVNSLKLSPNLRRVTPIPVPEVKKGQPVEEPPSREEVEFAKMEKILQAADSKPPMEEKKVGSPAAAAAATAAV